MSDTQTITIYGASDDVIAIDGDLCEEFSWHERPTVVAVSDGTLLAVRYTGEGLWRINRLSAGTAAYEKHEATDVDADYSDRVTLTGQIDWVACGEYVRRKQAK